jgi:3-phosphoshikimate 1-carboxyvinyltransferase
MYNTSKKIKGIVSLKGDKSLSHRALMIAALINDESNIYNISLSADVFSTLECLKLCGISIECNNNKFNVQCGTFTSPSIYLNCVNY